MGKRKKERKKKERHEQNIADRSIVKGSEVGVLH
jgi:hypothetical protein